jgi:hypothetical protein
VSAVTDCGRRLLDSLPGQPGRASLRSVAALGRCATPETGESVEQMAVRVAMIRHAGDDRCIAWLGFRADADSKRGHDGCL